MAVFGQCLGRALLPTACLYAIKAGPLEEPKLFPSLPAGIQTLWCCTNGVLCLWVRLGVLHAPEVSYSLPGVIRKITEDNQKLQY